MIGKTRGHHQIAEKLGESRKGAVYRARFAPRMQHGRQGAPREPGHRPRPQPPL